mgnify:CR=1 FL=1
MDLKDEPISAFAFDVGRKLEKIVEERNGNLSNKLEELQYMILSFRQQIKGNPNMLKMYDLYFNIKESRNEL